MPFFFCVSGFLLARHVNEKGWWQSAIRKRVWSLLVPYLIWCHINIVVVLLCGDVQGYGLRGWLADIGFSFKGPNVLWYIRALFLFVLLSPVLNFLILKGKVLFLMVLYVLYLALNPGHVTQDFWISERWLAFWRFTLPVEGVFYFSCGIFLWNSHFKIDKRLGGVSLLIGFCVILIRMFVKMQGLNDLGYLVPMAIPFVLLGIWVMMPERMMSKRVVGVSFGIYLVHVSVIAMFGLHVPSCIVFKEWLYIAEWAVVVVVSMGIVLSTKVLFPRCSYVLFGGR